MRRMCSPTDVLVVRISAAVLQSGASVHVSKDFSPLTCLGLNFIRCF